MSPNQHDGPTPDRAIAPAPHDFSPAAIMSWATAHAAEQARRAASRFQPSCDLTSAEILAGIAAEIDRSQPGGKSNTVLDSAVLFADMAGAIGVGRP